MSTSFGRPSLHEPPATTTGRPAIKNAANIVSTYLKSLFPFLTWIGQYNSGWLASDLIAGVTVGAIVVPQGMAYASLAGLDAQFGLYSSFVGVAIYWLFGTSKDISIGPVAVLSTVVGNLVNKAQAADPTTSPYAVAAFLSVMTGIIVLCMGLLRWGWIVNLVSGPSLSAFMTGSAITIACSQVPALLGLTGFSNREAPYQVAANILSSLRQADLNACLGLTALIILYSVRFVTTTIAERSPKHRRMLHLLNSMRAVGVILLYTLISWLAQLDPSRKPLIDVLGDIPRGFQHFGLPPVNTSMIGTILPHLPATIAVMLVEHMAIAKSFGRQNGYTIDASQEMMAIGATNLIGPFFGGYASTGSFSRTAIQSKAGARSPLAGVITGLVVLLAVQVLTVAFYYIPSAVLSAVVVHAVGDLVTPFGTIQQYWRVSPMEAVIFFVGVAASIIKSIEVGLYASVALSTSALFYRSPAAFMPEVLSATPPTESGTRHGDDSDCSALRKSEEIIALREQARCPGVIKYRLPIDLNYINSGTTMENVLSLVMKLTRNMARGSTSLPYEQERSTRVGGGDSDEEGAILGLPALEAVAFDFTLVRHIDVTAVQKLVDVRKEVDALDILLKDLRDPPAPIKTDDALRARIYERYLHYNGRSFPETLTDHLPRSSESVFTHGDLAPRNIMVDSAGRINGILDWELAGWYPDYWEQASMQKPSRDRD
ncbi:sulfate permease family protein [Sarocladium implicatum]|nr:sulfate permease family protein [Sarocladium implicatum]